MHTAHHNHHHYNALRSVLTTVIEVCGGSARIMQQAATATQQDRLVGLPVLLVHDHIDDGIDAGGKVEHYVAEDVEAGIVDVLVGHLDHRYGQVAGDEGQKDGQHHLRDAPLVSFRLDVALVLDAGRLLDVVWAGSRRHITADAARRYAGIRADDRRGRWTHP